MNKFLTVMFLPLFLLACTPAINNHVSNEWDAVQEYNYLETLRTFTGYNKIFPNYKEKMIDQDRELCMHEDAHQREITANGVEDQRGYQFCTLTPAGMPNTAHRWDGK